MPNDAEAATPPREDGRTTRWDDHKAERRSRILDAAVSEIREHGIDVTVQRIAKTAQIPRSVIYRVFKDRSDLDEQIRARILEDLMTNVGPTLAPSGTVQGAISRAVDTYVEWIVENPHLHQFLGVGSATRPKTGSRTVTGARTAIALQAARMFEELLRSRTDAVEIAEPMAFALVGLVDASVNRWLSRSMRPLTPHAMSEFLQLSIWQVLDGNLRQIGIDLDPQSQVSSLL